ncbi:hypothetical protein ACCC96_25055 [Pseudomonas sp. Pseusp11]|uniref:hypothetical protein n=1 Tax=Pseudomonas sp. Pseusp11 TaxID=3243003 RepID=UPI0039B66B9F
MKHLIIVTTSLYMSACATNVEILSADQRRMTSEDSKYVKEQLSDIYAQISKVNSLGALVAVPADRSSKPQVVTGDSPVSALIANPEFRPPREGTCYFIYSEISATEPLRTPCGLYNDQARQITQLTEKVVDQSKQIADVTGEIRRLDKGQFALGSVLQPLLSASKLNSEQIDLLHKQSDVIAGGFEQSVVMQRNTNDTLQKTLVELNYNNQELNKRLDTLTEKFGALK